MSNAKIGAGMGIANGSAEGHFQSAHENVQQKIESTEREAKAVIASMRDKSRSLARRLKSEIHERPSVGFVACGVAGLLLGSLLGSRAMRLAVVGSVGYLLSRVPFRAIGESLRGVADDVGESPRKHRKNRTK